jgi:hypothetical protein
MNIANSIPKFSPAKYSAMSVWDLYTVMTTLVSIKHTFDLTCRAQESGETAVFEWAEDHEELIDAELAAMASNLAGRLGLDREDEDTRDMAFARVDGYVPAFIWADGRGLRMRTARDLQKAGA